jgi:hypothetical protein
VLISLEIKEYSEIIYLWRNDAWAYGQTPRKFNNKYSGRTPYVHELGGR